MAGVSGTGVRARGAGWRLRREIREAMGLALRRYWLLVVVLTVLFILAVVLFASMTAAGVYPEFVGGVLVGGLVVGGAATILWMLDFVSGNRDRRFGLAGELATASLLEARSMKAAGWYVVHGVPFRGRGDIDHVAVGPQGVLAVESKWTTGSWAVRNARLVGPLDDPIGQVRSAADRLERYLSANGAPVPVTPVLVVWGKGCDVGVSGDRARDVLVLSGPNVEQLAALLARTIDHRVMPEGRDGARLCIARYLAKNPETKRVERRTSRLLLRARAS
jgi:hypothetical protein